METITHPLSGMFVKIGALLCSLIHTRKNLVSQVSGLSAEPILEGSVPLTRSLEILFAPMVGSSVKTSAPPFQKVAAQLEAVTSNHAPQTFTPAWQRTDTMTSVLTSHHSALLHQHSKASTISSQSYAMNQPLQLHSALSMHQLNSFGKISVNTIIFCPLT